MNITLKLLKQINACTDAQRAFADRFGTDGAPTAAEVFTALAEQQNSDWLIWLDDNLEGFIDAAGDLDIGDYHCRVAGHLKVKAGLVLASGSATVFAYDSATVRAYGSATAQAYDSATVEAYGSATVFAYGSATVHAYGSATVHAYDSATVFAYGSATVRAYDSATVRAYDSATVEASGSATVLASGIATVRAYDSATVRAYDRAILLLSQWTSLQVKFEIKSQFACAIDRRSGQPRLITAPTDEPVGTPA